MKVSCEIWQNRLKYSKPMANPIIFDGLLSLLFAAKLVINPVVDCSKFQAFTGTMTLCLLLVFPKVY